MNNFFKRICARDWLLRSTLVFALILSGCTTRIKTPYRIVERFPVEKRLEGEPLRQLEDCIGIIDVGMAGPYLICKEHKTKYHFAMYDSDLRILGHFGINGRGPSEYLAPIYHGQYEWIDSGVRFYIWERALHELCAVDIESEGDSVSMREAAKFEMPRGSRIEPRVLVRAGDNSFFGVADFEDCRFFTSDSLFNKPVYAEHVLPFDNKSAAHEIYQSCYGIKPDKSRIAIAYFCLPQIDIRCADGQIVQTIFLDKIVHHQELELSDLRDYFLKAAADDRYIYALCEDADSETSGRNSILVFDWSGNPVARYSIPRASSFTIDEQRIISVNWDQTTSLCSVFPISQNLP